MNAFLKCDAAGCDEVVPVTDIMAKDIGRPCPKCGASLLTQEDFDGWSENIQPGIDLGKALGLLMDHVDPAAKWLRIHLHENDLSIKAMPAESLPKVEP